jgi:FAD binding domain
MARPDSGMCAFRALVPAEQAPALARRPAQTVWLGPGRHLVHYPIRSHHAVNLVAFAPTGEHVEESWSATATVAEFLAEFAGWDFRVRELIRAAQTPGRWALLDRAPLKSWSTGRATLLGDAAHPMFPFYAQGAAQAIEDAATLAICLATERDNPEQALKTLRIRANPAHHTHPAAQPHPRPEQPPSRRPTAAGARRGPVGSRSPGAQWMDLRLRRRSSRAGRGDLNRADHSFRGHRRSTRHVPETALTAAQAVSQRQRQARCRPTRSESTRRTPRANAAGLRVWGGGLRGSCQPAVAVTLMTGLPSL